MTLRAFQNRRKARMNVESFLSMVPWGKIQLEEVGKIVVCDVKRERGSMISTSAFSRGGV